MTRSSTFRACLAVACLAVAACKSAPEQKPEDRLFSARQEYRETMDGLYRSYGGTDLPGSPTPGTPDAPGAPRPSGDVVGHVVSEADRSYFERQCVAVGRGERPFNLSAKMQGFLDSGENARGCRRAAELQVEIRRLEEQVGKP